MKIFKRISILTPLIIFAIMLIYPCNKEIKADTISSNEIKKYSQSTCTINTKLVISNNKIALNDYEINLIALVTMAEAEDECEYGKRMVIDTILNRIDSECYPNNAESVIYQPNQFTSMWNGRINRCSVNEQVINLVKEELRNRSNYDVIYFRTDYYSDYGTPLFNVGNHYFSSY